MARLREVHVAATIIQLPDSYILHKREKGTDKGEVGKLGLYGGEIEESEEKEQKDEGTGYRHAASRELHEESGLLFPPEEFEPLGHVHTKHERKRKITLTEAEVFRFSLPHGFAADEFKSGFLMTAREISRARALGQLTSVASVSFNKFLGI